VPYLAKRLFFYFGFAGAAFFSIIFSAGLIAMLAIILPSASNI
jgi:hypothetical protein